MAKIDFACKNFELFEVVRCALGLTKAETRVFKHYLKEQDWVSTEDAAEELDLDVSTVQRAVKKLYEKDVLERFQQNLERGGYMFVYRAREGTEVREKIMDIIDNWTSKVEEELQDLQ